MKLTLFAAGALCAVLMTGCNREPADQGGLSQEPATGTRQDDSAPPAPPPEPPAGQPADNTGQNVRDRSDATLTPGDQGDSTSDVELTRQIREAISLNDQFSISAENIKIITANGKVTLRGPVRSETERDQILQIVQGQPGVASVDNQLEVAPKQ